MILVKDRSSFKANLGMIIMEKIKDIKGLGRMLNAFKDLLKGAHKITFLGSQGFCTPFALFLGFSSARKGDGLCSRFG